ncbi:hypothetical protein HRbin30_00215 [bacterium HR30]|nr:hypothetical protein HRbin30_00215 [bacterium HR30]
MVGTVVVMATVGAHTGAPLPWAGTVVAMATVGARAGAPQQWRGRRWRWRRRWAHAQVRPDAAPQAYGVCRVTDVVRKDWLGLAECRFQLGWGKFSHDCVRRSLPLFCLAPFGKPHKRRTAPFDGP